MKQLLFIFLLAIYGSSWATGKPDPKPTPQPPQSSVSIDVNANAGASADASSNSWAGSSATGGNANASGGSASSSIGDLSAAGGAGGNASAAGGMGGSSSLNNQSRSNTYVFPAPSFAAPLPGYICPKGDSISWSIGWNFFSYSSSSTRTELECLEKYAALFRAQTAQQAPVMPSMYVVPFSNVPEARLTDNTPEPSPIKPAVVTEPAPKKPIKKSAPKKPAAVAPLCGEGEVATCTPKKTDILKKTS